MDEELEQQLRQLSGQETRANDAEFEARVEQKLKSPLGILGAMSRTQAEYHVRVEDELQRRRDAPLAKLNRQMAARAPKPTKTAPKAEEKPTVSEPELREIPADFGISSKSEWMTRNILFETKRLFPEWTDKTIKNKRADFFERTNGTSRYRLEHHEFIEFLEHLAKQYAARRKTRR